ncbi:hypothetical protein ScPMuIL_011868 [Solemya velum]
MVPGVTEAGCCRPSTELHKKKRCYGVVNTNKPERVFEDKRIYNHPEHIGPFHQTKTREGQGILDALTAVFLPRVEKRDKTVIRTNLQNSRSQGMINMGESLVVI